MKKHISLLFLLLLSLFAHNSWAQIIEDNSGSRYLTIGSTKDEVLEILGTPSEINANLNLWYYGFARLSFDGQNRVKEYTNAKALKILLLPPSHKPKLTNTSPSFSSSTSTINSSSSSKVTSPAPPTHSSSYIPVSSVYGEISEITGRPKTVHVNGYYRKDGTYVKPHYRSPPKRK